MKKVEAVSHLVRVDSKTGFIAMCSAEAKKGADIINALLQEAYDKGRQDEQGEPWRVSPFDDEDEAPLIDVPDGCDDPEYGPEKIPPRKGKSSLTAEIEELHKLLDEAKEQANKISLEAEKTYKNTTVSLSDMPVNHH